jgi:hypothetical protein
MNLLLWALRAIAAVPKIAGFIHELIDAIVEAQRENAHADNRDAIDAWLRDDVNQGADRRGQDAQLSGPAETVRGQTPAPDKRSGEG